MTARINQGMPRRMRSEPHTISEDEILAYLRRENWHILASSSREPKRLEMLLCGIGYRVTAGDVETYRGQNVSDAVRAYNEAR